jgi:DNA-binding NarL/FixJ family response regulator
MPSKKAQAHRVAVVDPSPCISDALAKLVEGLGLYQVVLQAGNSNGLMAALEGVEVDLVLVDLGSPEGDGPALLQWLTARPPVRSLAYGLPVEDGAVLRAYRFGALAALPYTMDTAMLAMAMQVVLGGGVYHTAYSQRVLMENPDGLSVDERRRQKLEAQMTRRQMEVLMLLCRDDNPSSTRIGKELGISSRTVDDHVNELLALFGVSRRPLLVRSAIRLGLVKV